MTVLLKGKLYPFSSFYIKAGEGGTPTTSVVEYYTEGTIPFIKIEDLSCKYLTNNKDFITELGMQKSSAWLIAYSGRYPFTNSGDIRSVRW